VNVTKERITTIICTILVFISITVTMYYELDKSYSRCYNCERIIKNQSDLDTKETNEETEKPVKTTSTDKLEDVQLLQNRIVIVDIVDYETALSLTKFPEYVTEEMKSVIMKYAYKTMNDEQYSKCVIIGMTDDISDNGIISHFVFNGHQYLCVWFNKESYRYITIYDKLISDLPKRYGTVHNVGGH